MYCHTEEALVMEPVPKKETDLSLIDAFNLIVGTPKRIKRVDVNEVIECFYVMNKDQEYFYLGERVGADIKTLGITDVALNARWEIIKE